MKLSMRIRVVSLLAFFLIMLASSAWAAVYTIGADVKLDSTGGRMELKLTYLKDGQPDPIWNILTDEQRKAFGDVFAMELYLNSDKIPGGGNRFESESPVVINKDGIEAVFLFTPALEEGNYIFKQFSFIGNAETNNWPDAQWEAYFNVHGINIAEVKNAERPYKGDDDHLHKINGGQPVSIVRQGDVTVPGAPTDVTATAGDGKATVSFKAPADNGGSAITSYTVTSNPDSITATGASTTITVAGLTNGTAYTFTVKATNSIGSGSASTASNSVTPTGGGGGGGGCNAGYGIAGLLLTGFVIRKGRKM